MKKYLLLIFLIAITLLTRYFLLRDEVIPFSFDHGKDSLAVLDMWLNRSPKLVGPWTSIPGLFFGPAWYYLLLPFYILFNGHPVGGAWAMVFLLLVQIVLAYKYLGKKEAIIITGSSFFVTISTSAWNPFPMALLSLLILIVLKQLYVKKELKIPQAFVLGSAAALGFHFSTAFAVLYPLLIVLSLVRLKIKFSLLRIAFLLFGFAWPFLPQFVFELRHQFIGSRAVWQYLTEGGGSGWSIDGLATVFSSLLTEIRHFILPNLNTPSYGWSTILNLLLLVLIAKIIFALHRRSIQEKKDFSSYLSMPFEYLIWVILPLFFFSVMHFNVWYLYALAPVFVMMLADLLNFAPKKLTKLLLLAFLLAPFFKVNYFLQKEKEELLNNPRFLPMQLRIVADLRNRSEGQPFSVYTYANDVYDFSYQYIYFYQALAGQKLPVEFSYKIDTSDYVVQKSDLIAYFANNKHEVFFNEANVRSFYLVEKPIMKRLLDEWWTRVPGDRSLLLSHGYSPELTLYYEPTLE